MPTNTKVENEVAETNDPYLAARQLAEAGNYPEALDRLHRLLEDKPDDAEAINDIGAVLFSQGQTDQAIEHFVKANHLCANRAEILWNLSEAYLADNQAQKAAELFGPMEQIGILNPDVLNRTANVFLQNAQLTEAAEMLQQSLQMAPAQQEMLEPLLTIIHSKITSNG